jgi:hypothetical protein
MNGQGVPKNLTDRSLYPQEEQIIDLWDAGKGMDAIMADTGLPRTTVRRVLGYLAVKDSDNWQRPASAATDQLAARILEVHGVPA